MLESTERWQRESDVSAPGHARWKQIDDEAAAGYISFYSPNFECHAMPYVRVRV